MLSMRSLGFSLTAVLVFLCGCGHGGGNTPTPATFTYAQAAPVYTKGAATGLTDAFLTFMLGPVVQGTIIPKDSYGPVAH